MGLAEMVDAPVLLVGDIDRGGVFAQLYGTVELLEEKNAGASRGLSSINSVETWRSCAPAFRCWKKRPICPWWASYRT